METEILTQEKTSWFRIPLKVCMELLGPPEFDFWQNKNVFSVPFNRLLCQPSLIPSSIMSVVPVPDVEAAGRG
jgi:hypothetical protein